MARSGDDAEAGVEQSWTKCRTIRGIGHQIHVYGGPIVARKPLYS